MSEELIQKAIFGKYKILKLLDKGAFGYVFRGKNIIDGQNVAIKVEDWKKQGNLLEGETYFLFQLKGLGVPEVKSFGRCGKYKILVETLLGNSLEEIFKILNKTLTLKDICMIAIQLVERLEYIHSKFIVHRDIKPENLMIDIETKRYIYLIDFGLAKRYRSGRTGHHIKFSIPKKLTGTARYASKNALRGCEQSRRDDLESAGYVLIYLAKNGKLPWKGLKICNKFERYNQIYIIKKYIEPEKLCFGLPNEFCDYIKYVNGLKFEEEPNYQYLKGLFIKCLNNLGFNNDLNFSWLTTEEKSYNFNKMKINEYYKTRISPQSKIIKNIENNKDKKKEINNSNNNIFNNLNNKINKSPITNRNNRNNLLESYSEKSGTQLTEINTSINFEEYEPNDGIINQYKILNKNNSETQINKKYNNILDENLKKEDNKDIFNLKNVGYKNEENNNNTQSIPIIFDPINGSFNSLLLVNQNNIKNLNSLNNINDLNNIKNNDCKFISNNNRTKSMLSSNSTPVSNIPQEKKIPKNDNNRNNLNQVTNNKEIIKKNFNKNNLSIHHKFFEIKKNILNRSHKNSLKKKISENNVMYRNKQILNRNKNNNKKFHNYNLNKTSINNNNNKNISKIKYMNNKRIIELSNINIKNNNSTKNRNFLNLQKINSKKNINNIANNKNNNTQRINFLHNTSNKTSFNNLNNFNRNNNTTNSYINIQDIKKRLILNINLNNNIIDKKCISPDNIYINKIKNRNKNNNKKYSTSNNSFNKRKNCLTQTQNNTQNTLNFINDKNNNMSDNQKLTHNNEKNQKHIYNLKLNINNLYNSPIKQYTSPTIVNKYKNMRIFNDMNFNDTDYNLTSHNIYSKLIGNDSSRNNIGLFSYNKTDLKSETYYQNRIMKLANNNLTSFENNYLPKSSLNDRIKYNFRTNNINDLFCLNLDKNDYNIPNSNLNGKIDFLNYNFNSQNNNNNNNQMIRRKSNIYKSIKNKFK